jgi:hypothetical protein
MELPRAAERDVVHLIAVEGGEVVGLLEGGEDEEGDVAAALSEDDEAREERGACEGGDLILGVRLLNLGRGRFCEGCGREIKEGVVRK